MDKKVIIFGVSFTSIIATAIVGYKIVKEIRNKVKKYEETIGYLETENDILIKELESIEKEKESFEKNNKENELIIARAHVESLKNEVRRLNSLIPRDEDDNNIIYMDKAAKRLHNVEDTLGDIEEPMTESLSIKQVVENRRKDDISQNNENAFDTFSEKQPAELVRKYVKQDVDYLSDLSEYLTSRDIDMDRLPNVMIKQSVNDCSANFNMMGVEDDPTSLVSFICNLKAPVSPNFVDDIENQWIIDKILEYRDILSYFPEDNTIMLGEVLFALGDTFAEEVNGGSILSFLSDSSSVISNELSVELYNKLYTAVVGPHLTQEEHIELEDFAYFASMSSSDRSSESTSRVTPACMLLDTSHVGNISSQFKEFVKDKITKAVEEGLYE